MFAMSDWRHCLSIALFEASELGQAVLETAHSLRVFKSTLSLQDVLGLLRDGAEDPDAQALAKLERALARWVQRAAGGGGAQLQSSSPPQDAEAVSFWCATMFVMAGNAERRLRNQVLDGATPPRPFRGLAPAPPRATMSL